MRTGFYLLRGAGGSFPSKASASPQKVFEKRKINCQNYKLMMFFAHKLRHFPLKMGRFPSKKGVAPQNFGALRAHRPLLHIII